MNNKLKTITKKKIISHIKRMLNLSLNELRLTAKSRDIKVYKDMSKEKLLSALSESESVESEKNLDNARIKKIRIE